MLNSTNIPRGNTCPGVNRAIIEYLVCKNSKTVPTTFLDVPCGEGEFLNAIAKLFPKAETLGCDSRTPSHPLPHQFISIDGRNGFDLSGEFKFDVITCISGIMEFDNTLQFLTGIGEYLSDRGLLFVTNDNVASVPDRLLYLLFGRWRQYKLFNEPGQSTWKLVTIQSLMRILADAGFIVEDVQYVPSTFKDWFWIPLAVPIYLCQMIYMLTELSSLSQKERRRLFPFLSLFSRHYIIICRRHSCVRAAV